MCGVVRFTIRLVSPGTSHIPFQPLMTIQKHLLTPPDYFRSQHSEVHGGQQVAPPLDGRQAGVTAVVGPSELHVQHKGHHAVVLRFHRPVEASHLLNLPMNARVRWHRVCRCKAATKTLQLMPTGGFRCRRTRLQMKRTASLN